MSSAKPQFNNPFRSRRFQFLGLDMGRLIQIFFGGNALVAILVLGLITLFLFREGLGFFKQNYESLKLYRVAGLEMVSHMKQQRDDFTALVQYLNDVRLQQYEAYEAEGLEFSEINDRLLPLDDFIYEFEEASFDFIDFVDAHVTLAVEARDQYEVNDSRTQFKADLLQQGNTEAAALVEINPVDFEALWAQLDEARTGYDALNTELEAAIRSAIEHLPEISDPALQARLNRFVELVDMYVATFPEVKARLASWDPTQPVPFYTAITTFFLGTDWTTNSFFQDWYGIWPLLSGSILVSMIALTIAVPLGIAGAIYVNQIAGPREQAIIKPYIEFIAAIPSVVIGFFGVAVWGNTVRMLSEWDMLSWLPFFPIAERLNAFTAGCLLALMAIPTIFTLAEDAINNVPRYYKEASLALGATRWHTIQRIILPCALSGIISAILLGFGRVIGETMVVLLCAGNRIAIPDFTGLGVVFEPVHTMTGIIAQEMGEVVRGSIHYRALFLVGVVLFFISLLINYTAQVIVRRYRTGRN